MNFFPDYNFTKYHRQNYIKSTCYYYYYYYYVMTYDITPYTNTAVTGIRMYTQTYIHAHRRTTAHNNNNNNNIGFSQFVY